MGEDGLVFQALQSQQGIRAPTDFSSVLKQVISLHHMNNEYFWMPPALGRRLFIIFDLSKEINYPTGEWKALTHAGMKMILSKHAWGHSPTMVTAVTNFPPVEVAEGMSIGFLLSSSQK